MTLLLRPDDPGWPWCTAILVAAADHHADRLRPRASIITKAGVPSFVVTLAGLLIWSGVVLTLTTEYSNSGTIRIQDETVVDIANAFLSDGLGWLLGVGSSSPLLRRWCSSRRRCPVDRGPPRQAAWSSSSSRSPAWRPS